MTMRAGVFLLLVMAALPIVARLSTGIVYLRDEPVACLVVKQVPALWIERLETVASPMTETVIDTDETRLVYGAAYAGLMRAAPVIAAVLAAATGLFVVLVRARRGRGDRVPQQAARHEPEGT